MSSKPFPDAVLEMVRSSMRDLSMRQCAVIVSTARSAEPTTIRGLAGALGVPKPSITRALDRLEKEGIAKRQRSTADLRDRLIYLTPLGAAMARQMGAAP